MCNLHSCGKVKVTGDFVKVSQLLTACCRFIYTWLILVGEVFVLGKDLVGKTVTGRPIFVELQERHHSVAHWRGGSRIKKNRSVSSRAQSKCMTKEKSNLKNMNTALILKRRCTVTQYTIVFMDETPLMSWIDVSVCSVLLELTLSGEATPTHTTSASTETENITYTEQGPRNKNTSLYKPK